MFKKVEEFFKQLKEEDIKGLLLEIGIKPQIILSYSNDKTNDFDYTKLKKNDINFFSILNIDSNNKISTKYSTAGTESLSEFINNSGKDKTVFQYTMQVADKEILCPLTIAEIIYYYIMDCINKHKQSSFVQILTT